MEFFSAMESFIKFTTEYEENSKLSFLGKLFDRTNNRNQNQCIQKTSTNRYLNFNQFNND